MIISSSVLDEVNDYRYFVIDTNDYEKTIIVEFAKLINVYKAENNLRLALEKQLESQKDVIKKITESNVNRDFKISSLNIENDNLKKDLLENKNKNKFIKKSLFIVTVVAIVETTVLLFKIKK